MQSLNDLQKLAADLEKSLKEGKKGFNKAMAEIPKEHRPQLRAMLNKIMEAGKNADAAQIEKLKGEILERMKS